MKSYNLGFTIMELIIAIIILSFIILGINGIAVFTRNNVVTADRRAKLQNDVSRVIDHVSRMSNAAIGNEAVSGANSVVTAGTGTLAVFVDSNQDGMRDSTVSAATDHWVYYNRDASNNIHYCNTCLTNNCSAGCPAGTDEIIARNMTDFTVSKDFTQGNFINVSVTACYNPAAGTCGTAVENPSVTMRSRIDLPGVSLN